MKRLVAVRMLGLWLLLRGLPGHVQSMLVLRMGLDWTTMRIELLRVHRH